MWSYNFLDEIQNYRTNHANAFFTGFFLFATFLLRLLEAAFTVSVIADRSTASTVSSARTLGITLLKNLKWFADLFCLIQNKSMDILNDSQHWE
mgnify:CR=1 FL=1